MPIADDWDFNYSAKELSHVDGVLSFDTGGGRAPVVGEYIIQNEGTASQAIGKVLAVTGNTTSGTLTLTNVEGLFEDDVLIEVMSELGFDGLTDVAPALQGFNKGDDISGQASGSTMEVRAIEYNNASQTLGAGGGGGTLYGTAFSGAFTDDELLDNDTTGQTDVGDADGVGVDNDAALTTTLANGTLAVPGSSQTNDSVIIHYDAGSQLIPEQAVVQDGSTAAVGLVEQQYGPADGSVGSLRIVDYDSNSGVWVDDNALVIQQVVNYDAQVGGQVFSVGDVVVGTVSGATGRVLAVIDDGDSTGRIILADESGTWNAASPDLIQKDGVTIAEVENTTFTLSAATLNLPGGIRTNQLPSSIGGGVGQGGIYDAGDSLNIVRKSNSFYTLSQDTFDELVQMDDDEALDATAKGIAYQVIFDWEVPDLSFRFLRKGAWTDTDVQNVYANAQTQGAQNKITDTAFLTATGQTFRQPQLYIEQNGGKIDPSWVEGQIDVMIKVKTWGDTTIIDPATPALGQLIPGGDPAVDGNFTIFNREFYTSTYDATQANAPAGGVASVALGTAPDNAADRNPQGTHTFAYDAGSGATLLVGEFFTTTVLLANDLKVGLVVAQTGGAGATGTIEYVLKSGTQFGDGDVLVGEVSGKAFTVDEGGGFDSTNDVVAGFSVDIALQVVDQEHTGGTFTGTFFPGEGLTDVGGWVGIVVLADAGNNVLYTETVSGVPDDSLITGDESGATVDPSAHPSDVDFPGDLNNGEGAFQYCGSVSGDLTGASAESMQNVYQYSKYVARHEEETYTFNGPGTSDAGTVGQFFRRLVDGASEVKPGNPVGVYTGSLSLAEGWFLDTDFIDAADIRSFTVIDKTGVSHAPPNLQSLVISGVASGWRVSAYRTADPGTQIIQRTEFQVGTIGTHNQALDTTIELDAQDRSVSPTPADVPDSGVLRILDPNNTGNYLRFPYSSVDRTLNVYTLASGDIEAVTGTGVDLTLADNAHVVLIEEQSAGATVSNTIQYLGDINIFYKARLKGFKPFRGTGTFTSGGATLPAQQTPDAIVDLP